mmetsp:Transcript_27621/g.44505  ORF Transcript_27621/g.44505 Transcript_27621/m.44505 type:complete len:90 (-) Transcript_27621:1018-1287(-)
MIHDNIIIFILNNYHHCHHYHVTHYKILCVIPEDMTEDFAPRRNPFIIIAIDDIVSGHSREKLMNMSDSSKSGNSQIDLLKEEREIWGG